MKSKIIIIVILLSVFSYAGTKVYKELNTEYEPVVEKAIPVEVMSVEKSTIDQSLNYQGRVTPEKLEIISFKSSARLAAFNGVVGDIIEDTALLVQLDTSDIELELQAAQDQINAANAEYARAAKGAREEDIELAAISRDKASEAVDYLSDQATKLRTLFEEGIVSQSELEGIELELELALKDLDLATKNYEKAVNGTETELIQAAAAQVAMAKTNEEGSLSLIEDAAYYVSGDHILVDQLYEVGELVPAGYPVAIIRSIEESVVIGVSGKDLDKIFIGQEVKIVGDIEATKGEVTRIAEIPDETHFLYEVEVSIGTPIYKIGEIVNCQLKYDTEKVILLPISAIMNDGIDYVYILKDGVATVKKVELTQVIEGEAVVTGLDHEDLVIISNLNRIHEQSPVIVKEHEDD